MADRISADRRSQLMSRVGQKNTTPELAVRRILHGLGYRYRLHRRDLPGTPDIVFPGRRKIIEVRGCFWHQHEGCRYGRLPKSREAYWVPKLRRNVERDAEMTKKLHALGWSVLVVWQCETSDRAAITDRMAEFLGSPGLVALELDC